MEKKSKRIGRPTKPPTEGERVSLGLRVTADLKRKLDEAAAKSGRSQSQEAEFRLERSFQGEDIVERVSRSFDKKLETKWGEMVRFWQEVLDAEGKPVRVRFKKRAKS